MARILRLVAAAIGSVLGIWYRAVLATPEVKRRKAVRRRIWGDGGPRTL